MQEVYAFLKQAGVYYLATTENGQPRVRPFGTIDLFDGRMYFQTGITKPVAQQMLADPRIEISAMCGEKWLRIAARAIHDENVPAQAHMLDQYPDLKAKYTAGDGYVAVFYLEDAVATISSFSEEDRVIRF